MNEIVDARNVGNVCRLCLSTKEPKSSVFADQAFATVSLSTKIQTFLSIEILASDGISTLICSDCLRRIDEWHTYKEHCLRSQQKLKQYKGEGANNQVEYIKVEPEDCRQSESEIEAVSLSSDEEDTVERSDELTEHRTTGSIGNNPAVQAAAIKREPNDEAALEMDSTCGAELLLNPMAVAGHKENRHTEMNSTKDTATVRVSRRGIKRKMRRGPQTHYRGSRRYKQRCSYCQIYLHSKYSYGKHMERFHSGGGKGGRSIDAKSRPKRPDVAQIGESDGITETDETAVEMNTETIEDVEEELMSLEKDAPLTPVQQSIISQLKTFSCYACRVCFTDRRSTLNHIRQHMPDLRPYTCIACLTEFADRSVYKLHCGASFQCAMKIALVVPEHGTEKYFTCNMCLRSMTDRRELLSHLSRHSDRQYERLIGAPSRSPPRLQLASPLLASMTSSRGRETRLVNDTDKKGKLVIKRLGRGLPAPYKNGDPAHNHVCVHCGMIYRYKQNMFKHVSLCKKLPPESRLCYRCVKCGMTFLAFNKFQTHVNQVHGRKKDLVCHRCEAVLMPSDFSSHMREHCSGEIRDLVVSPKAGVSKREPDPRMRADTHGNNGYGLTSSSPRAFSDGRKVRHPRFSAASTVTNTPTITFSCTICRCSFSEASILDAHMADHENGTIPASGARRDNRFSIKSDPGARNTAECYKCGKVFASHQNLRRHERNVHDEPVGRFNCFTCAKTFVHEHQWTEHVEKEHRRLAARVASCPQCPAVFESKQELILHRNNVHGSNGEDNLACYICGKLFASEASLKIHRGHHFRVNSRLSVGNGRETVATAEIDAGSLLSTSVDSKDWKRQSLGSPRARKSFPNRGADGRVRDSLQCQVCDDRFNDVSNLRKHLWDVHCARSKPEKPFVTEKLRCDICAIMLPDEESLDSHLRWHESDSMSRVTEKRESMVPCNLCGKHYSSLGNLRKHQKRHRVLGSIVNRVRATLPRKKWVSESDEDGFACNVCHKVFAKRATMRNHKTSAHPSVGRLRRDDQTCPDDESVQANIGHVPSINDAFNGVAAGFPVRDLSRETGSERRQPRQQRRPANSTPGSASSPKTDVRDPSTTVDGRVPCTLCSKPFRTVTNMRQHFTKMHATRERATRYQCTVNGCGFTFETLIAQRNHEKSHANVVYSCALCPRRMLNPTAMAEHVLAAHRTNRVSGPDRMTLCTKIDLDDYVVEGANGRQCPACGITYPNNKALKVHYLKVHENGA